MPAPVPTAGIEHHTSRHLRLNGHVAVDAERRIAIIRIAGRVHARAVGQRVRARRNQDLVDRAVADGGGELLPGGA